MTEWRRVALEEVAQRTSIRNSEGHDTVLTVSAEHGLVPQETYFTKRVASADLSTYSVIEPGDFVYNKSRAAGAPYGVVAQYKGETEAVVTPLYFTFRARRDAVIPEFLTVACNGPEFFESLSGSLREGARAHGLLNVRLGDFFGTSVVVPPLAVQREIVAVAAAMDAHVLAVEAECSAVHEVLTAARRELTRLDAPLNLESVCETIRSGGTPNRKRPEFFGGDIRWLKSGEVASPWITETEETVTPAGLDSCSAWLVPSDTTVVAMYGATAGQVGFVGAEMATNQAVLAVRADPNRSTDRFLYHWISGRAEHLKEWASGAAQPNLSKGIIARETGFPALALEEQREWVGRLDEISSLVVALEDEVRAIKAQRTAIIASLLRQDLAVRTTLPAEEPDGGRS